MSNPKNRVMLYLSDEANYKLQEAYTKYIMVGKKKALCNIIEEALLDYLPRLKFKADNEKEKSSQG